MTKQCISHFNLTNIFDKKFKILILPVLRFSSKVPCLKIVGTPSRKLVLKRPLLQVCYLQINAIIVGAANAIKWAHLQTSHIILNFLIQMKIAIICLICMLASHELANAQAPPLPDCPRGYVYCKLIFACCPPGQCRAHLNNV